jgi:hypothetical protein
MDDHFRDAFPDDVDTDVQASGFTVPFEIPDSVGEQDSATHPATEQTVNPSSIDTQDSEVEVGDQALPPSLDEAAQVSGLNQLTSTEAEDVDNACQATSQKGSLSLSIAGNTYDCQLDLGTLDDCRDKLNAIAANPRLMTQEFLHDTIEAVMPDVFSRIKLLLAVQIASFTLRMAASMLPDCSPLMTETFSPEERKWAESTRSEIEKAIPHRLWHGNATCFGRLHYLMTLLEGSVRSLAVPGGLFSTALRADEAAATTLRTVLVAIDELGRPADVFGTWAAQSLFDELPPSSNLPRQSSNAIQGPVANPAVKPDDYICILDSEDEATTAVAGSRKRKKSTAWKSPRDKNAPVNYCTTCHPQDSLLPKVAGSETCRHCCNAGTPTGKRRKMRKD